MPTAINLLPDSANCKRGEIKILTGNSNSGSLLKMKLTIEDGLKFMDRKKDNPCITKLVHQDMDIIHPLIRKLKILNEEVDTKYIAQQKYIRNMVTEDDLLVTNGFRNMIEKLDKDQAKNAIYTMAQWEQKIEKLESERKLRELKYLDIIHEYQVEFKKLGSNILDMQQKYSDRVHIMESLQQEFTRFKEISSKMNGLYEKYKMGNIKETDVVTCSELLNDLRTLMEEITKKGEMAEDDQLQEKTSDYDEVDIAHTENHAKMPESDNEIMRCVCAESFKYYEKLKNLLEKNQETYKPLLNNKYGSFRFTCKKYVNTPINAISAYDGQHILDKYNRILSAFDSDIINIAKTNYPELTVEQITSYILDLVAEKFISHGQRAISSKRETAYPIASVIIALWVRYPKFGTMFLAHLMLVCPYIIPVYYPRQNGQSDEEHYKLLGYEYDAKGHIEKQNTFLMRMSGVIRLYAAIIITPTRNNQTHPHGISNAWRWLAATLNLDPFPDISATLLFEFLDVTHYFLNLCYGLQFKKLIYLLYSEYLEKIKKVTLVGCQGPVVRLEALLETMLKGELKEPNKILDPKFW